MRARQKLLLLTPFVAAFASPAFANTCVCSNPADKSTCFQQLTVDAPVADLSGTAARRAADPGFQESARRSREGQANANLTLFNHNASNFIAEAKIKAQQYCYSEQSSWPVQEDGSVFDYQSCFDAFMAPYYAEVDSKRAQLLAENEQLLDGAASDINDQSRQAATSAITTTASAVRTPCDPDFVSKVAAKPKRSVNTASAAPKGARQYKDNWHAEWDREVVTPRNQEALQAANSTYRQAIFGGMNSIGAGNVATQISYTSPAGNTSQVDTSGSGTQYMKSNTSADGQYAVSDWGTAQVSNAASQMQAATMAQQQTTHAPQAASQSGAMIAGTATAEQIALYNQYFNSGITPASNPAHLLPGSVHTHTNHQVTTSCDLASGASSGACQNTASLEAYNAMGDRYQAANQNYQNAVNHYNSSLNNFHAAGGYFDQETRTNVCPGESSGCYSALNTLNQSIGQVNVARSDLNAATTQMQQAATSQSGVSFSHQSSRYGQVNVVVDGQNQVPVLSQPY